MSAAKEQTWLPLRSFAMYAVAAGAVAGVIYLVIALATDGGSVAGFLITVVVTVVVAFLLRVGFAWLFVGRHR